MAKIEWTEKTWNPVTGCTKISSGCKHCYAERMARRLQGSQVKYRDGFAVRCHESALDEPRRIKPTMIFVCSMADLLHVDVPTEFIYRVADVCNETPHTYQVLTKRSSRIASVAPAFAPNTWIGVSVEDQLAVKRAEDLAAAWVRGKRFMSVEPLIGPVDIPMDVMSAMDWVIVGGESGPGARRMDPAWVRAVRDRAAECGVPFWFKQWSGVHPLKGADALIDGRTHKERPAVGCPAAQSSCI